MTGKKPEDNDVDALTPKWRGGGGSDTTHYKEVESDKEHIRRLAERRRNNDPQRTK